MLPVLGAFDYYGQGGSRWLVARAFRGYVLNSFTYSEAKYTYPSSLRRIKLVMSSANLTTPYALSNG